MSIKTEVPLYFSDDDLEEVQQPKKKRGESKQWIFVEEFISVCAAEKAVEEENSWSILTTHLTYDGKKRFYRCNKVPRKGEQCAAQLYLLFDTNSDAVLLYRTDCEHNHDSIKSSYNFGICDETKLEINKLFDLRLKPKAILGNLNKIDRIKIPTKQQLYNYLAYCRRIKYETSSIHLGELKKWVISRTKIPDDDNEVFVIAYHIMEADPSFCFVLSSKNLLKRCLTVKILHADATYKLIWQGFPVLVVGTSDKNRKFHPICLTISTYERKVDFETVFKGLKDSISSIFSNAFEPKVLVCDAAKNIQDAFIDVFGKETTVRMCWAHAKKQICTKLDQTTNESLRKSILQDIDALQCATSPKVFTAASKDFLRKWREQKTFVAYFKIEWLTKNPNWYLGAAPILSPTTNNALESFTRVIKDENTLRERIPLSRFLVVAKDMVASWTQEALEEHFAITPEVNLPAWTAGYEWAKKDYKISIILSTPTTNTYLVPGDDFMKTTTAEKTYNDFDEYKEVFFSYWKTTLPKKEEEWVHGICECPEFHSKYYCKHLLGLAIRMKYVIPPPEAKTQNNNITLKRKRGRPTKARTPLIIQ
ncbi:uncharacterized protein [Choristoneura fumiferana]|uniref:uncharacterized protein n=1 Tax=Choristoneura fumiferana TaxID=7141 RepID=UPI003D155D03